MCFCLLCYLSLNSCSLPNANQQALPPVAAMVMVKRRGLSTRAQLVWSTFPTLKSRRAEGEPSSNRSLRSTAAAAADIECECGLLIYRGSVNDLTHRLARMGTTAEIRSIAKRPSTDGAVNALTVGRQRFRILRCVISHQLLSACDVPFVPDTLASHIS